MGIFVLESCVPRHPSPRQKQDKLAALDVKPVVGQLDIGLDPALSGKVLELIGASHVGICVCDENDRIRFVNAAWKNALFPDLPDVPITFADALGDAVAKGHGVRLETMPLGEFIPQVRARRQAFVQERNFSVDLVDGRWWWISEYKLSGGWTLAVSADISTVKHEEFKLRDAHAAALKDSHTDVLTGIANRRGGMEQAEAAITFSRQNRSPLALAILDIDHFKRINDDHGHELGDQVLIRFARTVADFGGAFDVVSRIGGEEFLVIMPGKSGQDAKLHLEALLRTLTPIPLDNAAILVPYSFSAGIASADAGEDLKALLARADAALYNAKVNGRQRIEIN